MGILDFTERCKGVRKTGPQRYACQCPAHPDRTASLSVRELDDGRGLIHCFAGCNPADILAAVGLTFDALFPPRLIDHHVKRERLPYVPADVFAVVRAELGVIAVIAHDMRAQRAISDDDYSRLGIAAERLDDIAGAAYERR